MAVERTAEGKLLELATRVLADNIVKINTFVEPVFYLVGQTKDNEESVLVVCRQILQCRSNECLNTVVCLAESQFPPEKRKYPNFAVDWRVQLSELGRGIDPEYVRFSNFRFPEGPVEHTGTEMMGLVAHARNEWWEDVILIASQWHQLRSFLSAVKATQKLGYPVRFWNCPGSTLPWNKQSIHSQGVQAGTRVDFLYAELEKVKAYSERGDIATIEEGIEYLNWRDSQA